MGSPSVLRKGGPPGLVDQALLLLEGVQTNLHPLLGKFQNGGKHLLALCQEVPEMPSPHTFQHIAHFLMFGFFFTQKMFEGVTN